MQIDAGRAEDATEGLPVFHGAGAPVSGEFVCSECGYGVSVRSVLPVCPMCRGSAWEELGTGPYAAATV